MIRLRAVIFDVDGTIAETEEAHRHAFNKAFEDFKLGWNWQPEHYKSLLKMTGGKERMHHYASVHHADDFTDIAPRIAEIHTVKTTYFAEIVASGAVELRPGFRRLIHEAIDNGVRLAIATTMSRRSLDALLPQLLGPDCYRSIDAIATGDRVKAKKPAPDLYQLMLSELGLAPRNAVAIEDSAVGLEAAAAAGIAKLITPSSYTEDDDFSEPDSKVLAGFEIRSAIVDLAVLDGLSSSL